MRKRETEALVVGAGPVGMLAALALAERGVGVEIVDEEWRSAARSYALGLHGRILELLDELDRSAGGAGGEGLVARLIERGHKLERIAFYDREEARAAVDLGAVPGDYPFLSRESLERWLAERAPWFGARVGEIAWSVAVQFERRLAASLGRGGVWLAGDAAHLGPPIGVHSMNRGLAEAIALAERMAGGDGGDAAFEDYERSVRSGWRALLELAEGKGVEATAEADPWVAERAGRILSCLPASGEDLVQLAGQLGLKV